MDGVVAMHFTKVSQVDGVFDDFLWVGLDRPALAHGPAIGCVGRGIERPHWPVTKEVENSPVFFCELLVAAGKPDCTEATICMTGEDGPSA